MLRAYEYRDKWVNRMVLGDSLMVMGSLLHYEGLGGQVQTIHMDPPHGVRFGSNFQPFVRKRDLKHKEDDDMTREPEIVKAYREPEMVKAYRDTWELGLHSCRQGACPARGVGCATGAPLPFPRAGRVRSGKILAAPASGTGGSPSSVCRSVHLDSAAPGFPLRPLTLRTLAPSRLVSCTAKGRAGLSSAYQPRTRCGRRRASHSGLCEAVGWRPSWTA